MESGRISEFNHPSILIENNGIFAQLVQQTGLRKEFNFKKSSQKKG